VRLGHLAVVERLVERVDVDQVVAAERLLGLDERTVGHEVVADGGRRRGGLQCVATQHRGALLDDLLGELPRCDLIKLDIEGAEPLAIVNAVAGLAKCLNMTSTAEGVETREQMEVLQSIGCTEMQGYLFSKARPAGEIRQFFTQGVVKKLGAA